MMMELLIEPGLEHGDYGSYKKLSKEDSDAGSKYQPFCHAETRAIFANNLAVCFQLLSLLS